MTESEIRALALRAVIETHEQQGRTAVSIATLKALLPDPYFAVPESLDAWRDLKAAQ